MKKSSNGLGFSTILLIIIFIIFLSSICNHSKSNSTWKPKYETGYGGTRKNSWAEDQKLKQSGYDPETYRQQHGY